MGWTGVLAFYADESGTFSVRSGDQPWVVLLAIGFDDVHWTTIEEAFNALKRRYFPDRAPHGVEIGSHELRMAHVRPRSDNPFSSLLPEELRQFGHELYAVIDDLPFAWCASVIHKPSVVPRLAARRGGDLFIAAYVDLLRSLDGWCRYAGQPGRLFLDQREVRLHGAVHEAIIREHERLRDTECWIPPTRVVERPYFQDSARSNHVQLADIVAYNVLRRSRDEMEYPYYSRIAGKRMRFDAI